MSQEVKTKERIFSSYQVFVITILAFLQFTVILDFMVLSPLSAILLPELHMTAKQFSFVVSAYAFSAGISGVLIAGFADKFDRKKLLMLFYAGFMIGTILCAVAPSYVFLLTARIVTGVFGGVIGSVSIAIITDLFKIEVRGRVMGFVQMSFAVSQVIGLPVGWELATRFGWHTPFWMIAGIGIIMGVVMAVKLKPVDKHLQLNIDRHPLHHLFATATKTEYLKAFLATALLATGGFMLMPFGSAFSINNLGIQKGQLTTIYLITGAASFFLGPLAGKLSDKIGKFKVFFIGTVIAMAMVAIYCNWGVTPLWEVIALNIVLFAGIMSRMISSQALMSAVPEQKDRGAFMGINASVQQLTGGIAAVVAGLIVVQAPSGKMEHYDTLGYVVMGAMIVALILMYFLNKRVQHKLHKQNV